MSAPTVAYKQLNSPSPRISATPQGLTAVVRFRVNWGDAFTFVNDVLGIYDAKPWTWPASPNMKAYLASIEPLGLRSDITSQTKGEAYGSTPGEYYQYAFVDVTFGSQATLNLIPYDGQQPPAHEFNPDSPPDPEGPIEMSSFQVTYATEMIKMPNGSLKWAPNDAEGNAQNTAARKAPENGAAYYRVPTFSLSYTLHNCIKIEPETIQDKVGKVNSTVLFDVCEKETLLLDGVQTSRREMSNGLVVLDVTLGYRWRSVGWNAAFADDGVLYKYLKKDGTEVYPLGEIHPNQVVSPETRWNPTNF